jgi:hypothetical protein
LARPKPGELRLGHAKFCSILRDLLLRLVYGQHGNWASMSKTCEKGQAPLSLNGGNNRWAVDVLVSAAQVDVLLMLALLLLNLIPLILLTFGMLLLFTNKSMHVSTSGVFGLDFAKILLRTGSPALMLIPVALGFVLAYKFIFKTSPWASSRPLPPFPVTWSGLNRFMDYSLLIAGGGAILLAGMGSWTAFWGHQIKQAGMTNVWFPLLDSTTFLMAILVTFMALGLGCRGIFRSQTTRANPSSDGILKLLLKIALLAVTTGFVLLMGMILLIDHANPHRTP